MSCLGILIYTKDTDSSITDKLADLTQLACAILSSSSAELVYQRLLKVFIFITELLMHSILIEFFLQS